MMYVPPRSVTDPAESNKTFTVSSDNTWVKGLTAHYILPNTSNYTSIDASNPSYTDFDEAGLNYSAFEENSNGNVGYETFDSGAKALLFAAYSTGTPSVSSNYDGVTTHSVNRLTTVLSVTDIGESTGSITVTFDNTVSGTCITGQRINDYNSYSL
jgi:hypothetical protein